MNLAVGVALQFVVGFATLFFTGRIFDKVNSETESSWMDDAKATMLIMVISSVVFLIPGLQAFTIFVYLGLIYFAFQLDGIGDIITFYFIHLAVGIGIGVILNLASLSLPIMETL